MTFLINLFTLSRICYSGGLESGQQDTHLIIYIINILSLLGWHLFIIYYEVRVQYASQEIHIQHYTRHV